MIASWMLFTVLVSVSVALAAAALHAALRSLRLPSRHVWIAGMLACLLLSALGLVRVGLVVPRVAKAASESLGAGAPVAAPARSAAAALLDAGFELLARGPLIVAGLGRGGGFWVLAAGWLTLSVLVLAAGLLTVRRFRRLRRAWPLHQISGIPVRVAPAEGPAVIGLLHPEIVVPAWLLAQPDDEQRMVALHEAEHIRGSDPLLAGMGFALAALLPWNPVLWWLLRGMRLAAEVDCDGRVLRHDVPTRAYGSLLIEMAGRSPRLSLGVSHLSESSSALKRRLRAMTAGMPRWARTRAAGLAAMAVLAILAACETRMPTAAEVNALDVQGAESHVRTLGAFPGLGQDVIYTVDGKTVTAAEAHALPAADIERMNVVGGAGGRSEVAIWTRAGAAASGVSDRDFMAPAQARAHGTLTSAAHSDALVLIDGVPATADALHALSPDQILTVNVYKGDGARRRSADPRAANGVIEVTTRQAPAHP